MRCGAGPGDEVAVGRKRTFIEPEWPSEYGQFTEIRLRDRRGGETIPVTAKIG